MTDQGTRIAYCPPCNAYRDHRSRTVAGGRTLPDGGWQSYDVLEGYECLTCYHQLGLLEHCDHGSYCPEPAEMGRNTTPEMWVRLGRQRGAETAQAQAEDRRKRNRRRTVWIAVGAGLLLLVVCCCGTFFTVGPGRNGI